MKQLVSLSTLLVAAAALAGAGALAGQGDWDEMVPVDHLRGDFEALYAGLRSAHADLYVHRAKGDYDRRYEEVLASLDAPLSRFDTHLAFQRFAAYGNVAHARIDFLGPAYEAFRSAGGRAFPLYPRIVDGVAYVGGNFSGETSVRLGDEIMAIDGVPMATWLERTAALISADTPYIAHSLLEFNFPRELWAVAGERPRFVVTLQRDGEHYEVTVRATTRDEQSAFAAEQPEAFALDSSARSYRMVDDSRAYLQPGPFYNVENPTEPWDNTAFLAFIDEAFEHFLAQGASTLIIDLRQNPGGDNSFSDAMLAWLTDEPFRFYSEFLIRSSDEAAASNAARLEASGGGGVSAMFAKEYARVPRGESFAFDLPYAQPRAGRRFDGEVYALVNRHSYSNAVNVAAVIQDYELGLIAGEKTADMATTYGSMEQFTLPSTGISVGFPKAHIIRPSGARAVDGVTPDLAVASPIVNGTEDQVLRKLLEAIGDSGRP